MCHTSKAFQSDCPCLWLFSNMVAQILTFVPSWRRVSVTSLWIWQASNCCKQWNIVPLTVCDSKACWERPHGFILWPGASHGQPRSLTGLTLSFQSDVHVPQKGHGRTLWLTVPATSELESSQPWHKINEWQFVQTSPAPSQLVKSIQVEPSHLPPWVWSRDKPSKPGPGWISDLQSCNKTTWSLSHATTVWEVQWAATDI